MYKFQYYNISLLITQLVHSRANTQTIECRQICCCCRYFSRSISLSLALFCYLTCLCWCVCVCGFINWVRDRKEQTESKAANERECNARRSLYSPAYGWISHERLLIIQECVERANAQLHTNTQTNTETPSSSIVSRSVFMALVYGVRFVCACVCNILFLHSLV